MKFSFSVVACLMVGFSVVLTAGCAAQNAPLNQISSSNSTQEQGAKDDFPEALLDPSKLNEKAPDSFRVKFETSEGDFEIEVTREWAPNGADRFYNMVKSGYFKDIYVFRAIKGFMFQFGVHGNPKVSAAWSEANIQDDKSAGISNLPGTISFAQTGRPNSRSCQMFVNLGNNTMLDRSRGGGAPFLPFGKVVSGMETISKINTEYGENDRTDQGEFVAKGNSYIKGKYPNLSYIKSVSFVEEKGKEGENKEGVGQGTPTQATQGGGN
ncbi:MAG: peptidylprolyl isomerase [Planctomycetota bacterium]